MKSEMVPGHWGGVLNQTSVLDWEGTGFGYTEMEGLESSHMGGV